MDRGRCGWELWMETWLTVGCVERDLREKPREGTVVGVYTTGTEAEDECSAVGGHHKMAPRGIRRLISRIITDLDLLEQPEGIGNKGFREARESRGCLTKLKRSLGGRAKNNLQCQGECSRRLALLRRNFL